jgi:dienelactone hydrolase
MTTSPTNLVLAGIELHLFGLEHGLDAPVVFLTHGRGGKVEHVFDNAAELAADGMIAIGIEQRNHGKRMVDEAQNSAYGPTFATDFYGMLLGTAADISLAIDLLPARLGLRLPRIGVTGASMGGHVTLLAMARDPRITAGAALIGSGDFLATQRARAADNDVAAEQLDAYLPPALVALAARVDPLANAAGFADRPVLLCNGEDDTLVPILGNERFHATARPHYSDPDRLRFTRYPGVGHAVPPAMWAEARAWLGRWLLGA